LKNAPKEAAVGQPTVSAPPARKLALTTWQLKWGGLQALVLLVFVGVMLAVNYSSTSLLFTTPTGLRLLVQSVLYLAGGVAGGVVVAWLLDRTWPGWHERPATRLTVRGLLGGAQLVLFFLPAVYVTLIGPSIIRITQQLVVR
jgi:hypothetical protein